MTSRGIVDRARGGDSAAAAALYREHLESVLRYARTAAWASGAADPIRTAEDATANAFLAVLYEASVPASDDNFGTAWLRKARDKAKDEARLAKRHSSKAPSVPLPAGDDGRALSLLQGFMTTLRASGTSDDVLETWVLVQLLGLTPDEVAQRTGLPANTVRGRTSAVSAKLRASVAATGVALTVVTGAGARFLNQPFDDVNVPLASGGPHWAASGRGGPVAMKLLAGLAASMLLFVFLVFLREPHVAESAASAVAGSTGEPRGALTGVGTSSMTTSPEGDAISEGLAEHETLSTFAKRIGSPLRLLVYDPSEEGPARTMAAPSQGVDFSLHCMEPSYDESPIADCFIFERENTVLVSGSWGTATSVHLRISELGGRGERRIKNACGERQTWCDNGAVIIENPANNGAVVAGQWYWDLPNGDEVWVLPRDYEEWLSVSGGQSVWLITPGQRRSVGVEICGCGRRPPPDDILKLRGQIIGWPSALRAPLQDPP